MSTLASLWTAQQSNSIPEFRPAARYIAAMDCLIYLREDCSYRAVRLNPYQTILLHPYEDRPVGIKLKGVTFLRGRLKAIFAAAKTAIVDRAHVDMITFWELALTASADDVIADAEAERQTQLGQRAREIVESMDPIPLDEIKEAA
jgi:hypothetical protein